MYVRIMYKNIMVTFGSCGSVVGIATGYWLDNRRIWVWSSPVNGKEFSLFPIIQIGSEAHPASYMMGTDDCFCREQSIGGVKLTTHLH
jgi:hypothetical protein